VGVFYDFIFVEVAEPVIHSRVPDKAPAAYQPDQGDWRELREDPNPGGAQLAGVPGQRGADPGGEERGAGAGVRGRAGVEPDGRRGGGAPIHGAPGQARHRLPGGEAVTTRSLPAGS